MKRRVLGALAVCAVSVVAAENQGQDWPQFRGIKRDGQSTETGLLKSWPDGGPKQVWRQPLGDGYSEIVVVGNKLYTTYVKDVDGESKECVASFDAQTGKELWSTPIAKRYDSEFGNGTRSTTTVDGDRLYILSATGDFVALATADGKQLWKVNLPETFGSAQPNFGWAGSALADGDQVVLEAGGPEGKSYAGFERATGKTKWTVGTGGRQPGYNSPLLVDLGGGPRYVYIAGGKIVGLDRSGKQVWTQDWPRGETHAMPVFVAPDRLFVSGAEGVGAALFRVKEDGANTTVEELWKQPAMRNHFSSSVVHDGYIYGFDNATLKCIRLEDGSLAWAKRGLGKGSLIYADGHLLGLSDAGRLSWVEANPEAYTEVGSVQALEGRCWTAPTLGRGRVYVRNYTEMVAYELR
jgi:outer membrane protein assembly factor BamB